ncbi:MAG: hypothetical protein LUI39_13500, partial [Lachnospiraceae bacterium]|nr:hypothetical protein [Lachnospiraceae bacterium]
KAALFRGSESDTFLIHYIKYIHEHISLYVLSLSKKDDGMSMWNYYGQGGIELEFSADDLVNSLKKTFNSKNEFLAEAPVIYADSNVNVEEMNVPEFSKFMLKNKDSDNIFDEHYDFIKNKAYDWETKVYKFQKLDDFIKYYIKSYITTLNYLINYGQINENMSEEGIFDKVFDNVSKLNNYYYWKHDLSLYMLVLSALIKSDTYEHEKEYRIVYFEYNINSNKTKKEEYCIKHISSGDFIYPYITFKSDTTDDNLLKNSLKKITISPATKNLPINDEIYKNTLKRYIRSKKFNEDVEVCYSQHFIRW